MTSSAEIIEKLRLKLPLAVTLHDPLSGGPFTVTRDNVLALLVVDTDNIVLELQTTAVLYGEMARVHAAAKARLDETDLHLRRWKAQRAQELRSAREKQTTTDAKGVEKPAKPPTGDEVKEHYRTHRDYETMYAAQHHAAMLYALSEDLKRAFELKARALRDLAAIDFGHTRAESNVDRLVEMSSESEQRAHALMAEAGEALHGNKPRRRARPVQEKKA